VRFAASHPDKFEFGGKERATSNAQEINNARDELRKYWRVHGRPPPTRTDAGPQAIAPPSSPPSRPRSPVVVGYEAADAPEPSRIARTVLPYAAVAAASLFVVAGALALWPAQPPEDAVRLLQADIAAATPTAENAAPAAKPDAPPATALSKAAGGTASMAAASSAPVVAAAAPPAARTIGPPPAAATAARPVAASSDGRDAAIAAGYAPIGTPPPRAPATAAPGSGTTAPAGHPAARQRARDPLMAAAIRACWSDMRGHCAGVQTTGGHMARCLVQHFWQLAPGCRSSLLAIRENRRQHVAR
jgi:hypothetical protein